MVEDEISRELASFRDNEPLYQSIKDEIDSFSEVLGQKGIRHIWESRVKTQASLEGKLRKHLKDGKNGINGIADLVGGRIVLLKIKDLETVTDLIKENFQLEEDPIQHPTSKEHASQLGQRFRGYDGLHFRFRLKEEHKSEVIVEIQVVHVIMWIYYEVEHDLGYKGGQNSEELDRVLGMLKGAANLNAEAFAQFEEVFGNQKLKGGRIEVMNPVTQSTEASSEKPIVATQIRILLETQDMLRNILQDEKNERQALFNWLSKMQPKQHHKTMGKDFMDRSGEWLLYNTSFQNWWKDKESSILWLHGIPGSGKSKLVYSIIQRLSNEITQNPTAAPLAFFYCSRNASESERSDPDEIMRSILKQLCCTKVDLPVKEPLASWYKVLKKESDDDGNKEPPKLTCEECVDIIVWFLKTNPAVIVLDGLDECDPIRRHELLLAFDKIIQNSLCVVKIFVSSRDDGDIVCRLKKSPNVYIKIKDNHSDIRRFVFSEVERAIAEKRLLGGDVTKELKSRITDILIRGSQGMFRWVSLQIQNLCDPRLINHENEVVEELGKLPKTLNDSYHITYQRIQDSGSTSRRVARYTMTWLLCAQRPMSTEEFLAAVSVDTAAVDSTGLYISLSPSQLLNMCCNMIILDEEMNVFRFAHLSVQEYLEKRGDFDEVVTNSIALEICLSINRIELKTYPQLTTPSSNRQFKNYAMIAWPFHCQAAGDELEPRLKECVIEFLSSTFATWRSAVRLLLTPSLKLIYLDMYDYTTPLYLVFRFGLTWAFYETEFFESWWNIENTTLGVGSVHIAAKYGQKEMLRLLLDRKEMINNKRILGKSLAFALQNGHSEVADLLLGKDIDINSKAYGGSTPLHVTCMNRDAKRTQLLLQKQDLDVNSKDGRGFTPLSVAVGQRDLETVAFLLRRKDINVNAEDNNGCTPLFRASENRDVKMAALLLQNSNVDINAKNNKGRVPLSMAAENGDWKMVALLLQDKDINVNAEDDFGFTPVSYAIGDSRISKLFLDCGGIPKTVKPMTISKKVPSRRIFEDNQIFERDVEPPRSLFWG